MENKPYILKVLGIALALPSSILGVFAIVYYFVSKGVLSLEVALTIIVAIITYSFYLMLRYANKK